MSGRVSRAVQKADKIQQLVTVRFTARPAQPSPLINYPLPYSSLALHHHAAQSTTSASPCACTLAAGTVHRSASFNYWSRSTLQNGSSLTLRHQLLSLLRALYRNSAPLSGLFLPKSGCQNYGQISRLCEIWKKCYYTWHFWSTIQNWLKTIIRKRRLNGVVVRLSVTDVSIVVVSECVS